MLRALNLILLLVSTIVMGGVSAPVAGKATLADRLSGLRSQVLEVEKELIEAMKARKQASTNLKRIRMLMKLQGEERLLGRARMAELEKTIHELEARRVALNTRILTYQGWMRTSLMDINRSLKEVSRSPLDLLAREEIEAPRRRVLAHLVERNLKEIASFKVALKDADQLELRIQDEKQQLVYLFQDLTEQESVLELNRQLQLDLLRKKHEERLSQLDNYSKLKVAESQVEKMIHEFNVKKELEHSVETERLAYRAMREGDFARARGRLPLPIRGGRIVSFFGKTFDSKLQLNVFKKGIEIASAEQPTKEPVYAVSSGKVAYSGELPTYGLVTIIDHGAHYYSLCAHLGELKKQVGDSVGAGDIIGLTNDAGAPLYFEIRVRNVAVNPLQWVSN